MKKTDKPTKTINAYKYAQEFEKLSLEIVAYKENIPADVLLAKDVTQKTRDHGVDAYILFRVNGIYSKYTIEAKLRNGNTLSLKDFATSILYCLINTNAKHFVVTNVSFSDECVRYISDLNAMKYKKIELLDGELIKNIINSNCNYFRKRCSKRLINYIIQKETFPSLHIVNHNPNTENISDKFKCNFLNKKLMEMNDFFKAGSNLLIVSGYSGVGKHTLIKKFCEQEEIQNVWSVFEININLIPTPRALIVEFLRLILGIDVTKLFQNLSDSDKLMDSIFSELQKKVANNSDIMIGIKYALTPNGMDSDSENYIYFLSCLWKHWSNILTDDEKIIFIIENMHSAHSDMINFVKKMIQCMCRSNVIFIMNTLIPNMNNQLAFVSENEWNKYIKELMSGGKSNIFSSNIILQNMKYDETVNLIDSYLEGLTLTPQFYTTFIHQFGTNFSNVIMALKIIKNRCIYSSVLLKGLPPITSLLRQDMSALMKRKDKCGDLTYGDFYKEFFSFTCLLDGQMDEYIFSYFSEKYKFECKLELMERGILDEISQSLSISYAYVEMIRQVSYGIDEKVRKESACWLLDHIDKIQSFENRKEYFRIIFIYVSEQKRAILQMNKVINSLKKDGLFLYMLDLMEKRYLYYLKINQQTGNCLENHNQILCYKYAVIYIQELFKYQPDKQDRISSLLKGADIIKQDLAEKYYDNNEYINTNLQLALINYDVAKYNYDYDTCKQEIDYILQYESQIEREEIFALANIYKALIYKEYGDRKKYIIQLAHTLAKYSQNKDVKVAYYVNLAAMYKFKNIDLSIKLLNLLQKVTYNPIRGHGDLWSKVDLLNYNAYQHNLNIMELSKVRGQIEKKNSLHNLARTFNIEGYYNFSNNNILLAKECLQTAIYNCFSSGKEKQYFLYLLNLINILIILQQNSDEEFYQAYSWFHEYQSKLINRLQNNICKKIDHIYVAIISLCYIIKKRKEDNLLQSMQVDKIIPEIEKLSCQQLIKLVPEYYINQNIIFILF